jgi:hypothetical protein
LNSHQHTIAHGTTRRALAAAFCLVLAFTLTLAANAEPPNAAQLEIDHLLSFTGASKCEFYRNGSWYTAAQAQQHLHEKLVLLTSGEQNWTAEEFIDKVATKSAITGLAYQIRCAGLANVSVNYWLTQELRHYRQCALAPNQCVSLPRNAPDPVSSK